jgi:hypothetical protein
MGPGLIKPGKVLALYQLKSPRLQSEIIVTLFLFASRFFLANNLRFKVKVIDKTIAINVNILKNERKRLYSSNKENLTCLEKSITATANL